MSDADRVAQIGARLAGATKPASGKWSWGWDGVEGCYFVDGPVPVPPELNSPHGLSVWDEHDADLIANAPSDMAWLLDQRTTLLRLLDAERARADAAEALFRSAVGQLPNN